MNSDVVDALKDLLETGYLGTQEELCQELAALGFRVSQSHVSRSLSRIGAIRTLKNGVRVYSIPRKDPLSEFRGNFDDIVIEVDCNDTLVVVKTIPGAAQFVGAFLDRKLKSLALGIIAGDDTLMIAPRLAVQAAQLKQLIQKATKLS